MKTGTQPTARQIMREKHKRERKELREKEAVAEILPVPANQICVHQGFSSASYETSARFPARYSIAEALPIIDAWRKFIIPAEHWRDSCLAVRPPQINSAKDREFAKREGESFISLELSAGEDGHGYESHEIEFYAKIGERIIFVTIKIKPRAEWLPGKHVEREPRTNRIISSAYCPRPIGEDKRVSWWNPPGSYSVNYYWCTPTSWDAWISKIITEAVA